MNYISDIRIILASCLFLHYVIYFVMIYLFIYRLFIYLFYIIYYIFIYRYIYIYHIHIHYTRKLFNLIFYLNYTESELV